MKDKVLRKLFHGFIQVHILYHAGKSPVFGSWMIEELKKHGYEISAGTLYPLLHELNQKGLLEKREKIIEGRTRKYYSLTPAGKEVLEEVKDKAFELVEELKE